MSDAIVRVEGSGGEFDADIGVWTKDLLPLTPGCVAKVRKRAVILACREFFELSAAWRVVIGPKPLRGLRPTQYLSPYDSYANVVRVLGASLGESPLGPMVSRPPGREPTAGQPTHYYMETPDRLRLWPRPAETTDSELSVYVALTPKTTVCGLPQIAMSHFYDAIFDGAAGRLLSQPVKPYSDPTRAQYHLRRFRAAIGRYAGQAKSGFSSAKTWNFPSYAM